MAFNRREFVVTGIAAAAVASIPLPASAAPELVAEMFYTEDEPWGAFVRGHVQKDQFDKAVLRMIETDRDARENGEDWLWEERHDDDGEVIRTSVCSEPQLTYMHITSDEGDRGLLWNRCDAWEPGAQPITVVMY
ncbi:hypothetical protein AB8B21_05925 [Tardiphaga sp. 866_E4_N2_1]|uniref:hypothetical protein n=1 Tax=unclassified Tardiphaga TaxID=2631404 RepID=UPI003F21210D